MRYQSSRPRKQFLAGVSCPKCQSAESIVHVQIFEPEVEEHVECIECDYVDYRPSEDSIRAKNQPKITNAGIQVVSLTGLKK